MRGIGEFIFCILFPFLSFGESSKPTESKEPAWATLNKIDYSITSLDKEAEDGYVDFDYEKQVNLIDQSVYVRQSTKILSEAGVQDNSQITVNFDPSYQQLIFHTIEIIRDGIIINKLDLEKIKTIHEEKDLDKFIYNGQLQSILVLEDVRNGDVIEYSYTLKGFNPIFQNKYQEVFDTNFGTPLYNLYYKIILQPNRRINIKNSNENINPVVHNENAGTIYEWRKTGTHALHVQDELPDWYDPYSSVMISEFNSWAEVNNWAMLLFPTNPNLPSALKEKINKINTANKTAEEKTSEALRFVEDEIRYMGIEMGIHSHKPADPGKVFNQRFGDCKEKSYLLCIMLNAMGINARPVLINTDYKRTVASWLPAPIDFDHCTVRVVINDKIYWLDPTINYQRGSLADISYPNYQCGLIVTDTTTALSIIKPVNNSHEDIKETFIVPGFNGICRLKVITTYSGYYADDERNDFNSNSNYEMQKKYLAFYQAYFNNINSDSLTYADNDTTGIFTTTEYYSIDSLWKLKDNTKTAEFLSYEIDDLLKKPKETSRFMPIGLYFPSHVNEQLDIYLPDNDWNLTEVNQNIQCAAFSFIKKSTVYTNHILISYDYQRLKDNVMPDEVSKYFSSLQKINDDESYELTWGDQTDDQNQKTSYGNIIGVVVIILIAIGIAVRWTQKH